MKIRIHRFHDMIAFDTEHTHTIYLTPELAYQLAAVLQRYATDCETTKFTESQLGTKEIGDQIAE